MASKGIIGNNASRLPA